MKVNSGQAPSTLVPKYIGSDFDKVVDVATNIEDVKTVAKDIENVGIVADNIGAVNNTGNNIDDVTKVSDNIDYVKDVAQGIEGLPVISYIGDEPPKHPAVGASWYCTTDGRTYVWYEDIDSKQWVESSPQSTIETDNIFALWKRSVSEAGLNLVAGSFEEGGVLTSSNDVLLHKESESIYVWSGVFPKVVAAGSTPTPLGSGGWVDLSDVTLRNGLASSTGSSLVGFQQAGAGANPRTSQDKMRECVSVKDFGAVGDGIADDTDAIQKALDTGKSLHFPAGVYLTGPLTIPFSARGAAYQGDGSFHYDATHQTVIKAKTVGQPHIFLVGNSGVSGADCLSFKHIRFDCDGKAQKGIDATFGAFFTMTDCGVYNYTSYGVYHKQGLARYDRVFMNTSPTTHPTAVGLHLYSDSAVTDSEFSGGGIPLKIVAGGNRIVNVWANTGAASCITLTPFDASTTHINTSMVNVYAGEVLMTAPSGVRPIIEMVGTPAQKVQEVQFSNSYLVTAAGDIYKKNGGIYMDYCDAVSISNIVIRGNGLGATANLYCDYFVKAQRSKTIAITGCSIKDVNKNPIYLVSAIDQPVVVSGCTFYNWAVDAGVVGAEAAAIRIGSGTSAIVTGCMFHCDTGSAVPYAVNAPTAADINFTGNRVSFANPAAITLVSGTPAAIYESSGQKQITGHIISNTSVNNAKQNYLERGQVTAGANSTTNLVTLVNDAENQTYLLSIRQSGSGVNSVIGFVSANSGSCKAYRISQDNTGGGALDMNITNSGLTLQLVLGSGYGSTTWDWVLTRLG